MRPEMSRVARPSASLGEAVLLCGPGPPPEFGAQSVLHHFDVDMAISNFHVQFDHGDRFKPGEDISGKVVMDVWSTVEIRFVEFVILGKGTVRLFKDSTTFMERPRNEIYLDKKIVLIGPENGGYGVTLKPGRYVTSFKYLLPEKLPPTVHQFDMGNGYVFDISYNVQAHVCDYMRSRYVSAGGSHAKVIKATKRSFTILPQPEWHSIPGALEPISHTEQLLLLGGSPKNEPTSVMVTLDRAVYPIGDNIKINIEVFSPNQRQVKDIRAELEQQLDFCSDQISKFRRVLIKAFDDRKRRMITDHENMVRSIFSMPVPPNLVPSYLPHCHMLDVSYTMKVTISFKKLGGRLVIRVPVVIAPAGEIIRKVDDANVPVFNKPILQFPYFNKKSPRDSIANGYSTSSTSESTGSHTTTSGTSRRNRTPRPTMGKHDRVTTKYKTALPCCGCCLLCFGFGILEET